MDTSSPEPKRKPFTERRRGAEADLDRIVVAVMGVIAMTSLLGAIYLLANGTMSVPDTLLLITSNIASCFGGFLARGYMQKSASIGNADNVTVNESSPTPGA